MFKSVMLRPWKQVVAVIGLVLGTWSSVSAQEGLFSVGDLERLSKLIVVGTISEGAEGQLSLSVDRVLKGSSAIGSYLSVTWTPLHASGCDTTQPTSPVHGIWFLEKESDGSIEFAPFMNSQLCDPSGPDYGTPAGPLNEGLSYKPSDTVRYKLAVELASALLDSTTMPDAIQHYPGIFGGLNATQAEHIFHLLESSPSQEVRMIGDLNLIASGSPSALQLLASNSQQLAQTPLPNAVTNSGNSAAIYKSQVAQAISEIHNTSAYAVSVLAQIATNKDQDIEMRRAASRALRNIHSAQALVAIAPLIGDPDELISTYAVSAIACYANAVPVLDDAVPGHNLNLNNEGALKTNDTLAHFVIGPMGSDAPKQKAYWQQWWQNHHSSIQQTAEGTTTQ